jgi:hypothetical protein
MTGHLRVVKRVASQEVPPGRFLIIDPQKGEGRRVGSTARAALFVFTTMAECSRRTNMYNDPHSSPTI